jgi:hypothetical protein
MSGKQNWKERINGWDVGFCHAPPVSWTESAGETVTAGIPQTIG